MPRRAYSITPVKHLGSSAWGLFLQQSRVRQTGGVYLQICPLTALPTPNKLHSNKLFIYINYL